jgi:hypothetical protein
VAFTDAPLGQATAKPDLLEKSGPGGCAPLGAESTTTVYAQLLSVVAISLVVTSFGVPLLRSGTEMALEATVAAVRWLLGSQGMHPSVLVSS